MFLMTSHGDVGLLKGSLKTDRRAFFPACHSAKVGSGLRASFCVCEVASSSCRHVLLSELNDGVLANKLPSFTFGSSGDFKDMYAREGSGFIESPGGLDRAGTIPLSDSWFQSLLTSSFFHWVGWNGMEEGSSGVGSGDEPHIADEGVMTPGVLADNEPHCFSSDPVEEVGPLNTLRVPSGVPPIGFEDP